MGKTVAKTKSKMALLNIERSLEMIERQKQLAENQEVDFFLSLAYFKQWTRRSLVRLMKQMKKIIVQSKQTVIREGDPSSYVYIVLEGDFEQKQSSKETKPKDMDYTPFIYTKDFLANEIKNQLKKEKKDLDKNVQKMTRVKTLAQPETVKKSYTVAILN